MISKYTEAVSLLNLFQNLNLTPGCKIYEGGFPVPIETDPNKEGQYKIRLYPIEENEEWDLDVRLTWDMFIRSEGWQRKIECLAGCVRNPPNILHKASNFPKVIAFLDAVYQEWLLVGEPGAYIIR